MTWAQTLNDVPSDMAASLWGDEVLERVGIGANLVYRLTSGDYFTPLEVFKRGYEQYHTLHLERLQTFGQLRALLSLSWSLEDASWSWSHDLRRLTLEGTQL